MVKTKGEINMEQEYNHESYEPCGTKRVNFSFCKKKTILSQGQSCGGHLIINHIKTLAILFLCLLALFVLSCTNENNKHGLSSPSDIPTSDLSHIVSNIFSQMSEGEIDHQDIIYGQKQKPPKVPPTKSNDFPPVEFPVKNIKISEYDSTNGTVKYSCIVPHPAVVWWQWKPVSPEKLTYKPQGIPMKGELKVVKDNNNWKVRVDNNTNPISLYNKVVLAVNQTRFTMTDHPPPTPKLIQYTKDFLVEKYITALDLHGQEKQQFKNKMAIDFEKTEPQAPKSD